MHTVHTVFPYLVLHYPESHRLDVMSNPHTHGKQNLSNKQSKPGGNINLNKDSIED